MSATVETIGELPPYLAAAYREAAERALKLSQEAYEAYSHRRVAPQSPHTHQALNLSQEIGSYAPHLQAAHHQAKQGTRHFPSHYQEYMEPYKQEIVNNLGSLGQKSFTESFLPELEKRFSSHGSGISRHPNFRNLATQDIQNEITSQQQDAMSRGYQHAMSAFDLERARALEASGLFNRLGVTQQAGKLADIQALREAGMISQAQEQSLLDQEYENWKEEKRHPYEKLMEYFGILQGTPYIPSTYVKRETARPSDTYHHNDWRNMAEGIGINALGGILSGHEPSPAIIAAFKNVLPGGDIPSQRSRSRRVVAEEAGGRDKKQAEEARDRQKQEDFQRVFEAERGRGNSLAQQDMAQRGGIYNQGYYDDVDKLARQKAEAAALSLQAARDKRDKKVEEERLAAVDLERKRVMDEYRASKPIVKKPVVKKPAGDKASKPIVKKSGGDKEEHLIEKYRRSLIGGPPLSENQLNFLIGRGRI